MEHMVIEMEYLVSLIYNIPQSKPIFGTEEKIKHASIDHCHLCGKGNFTKKIKKNKRF